MHGCCEIVWKRWGSVCADGQPARRVSGGTHREQVGRGSRANSNTHTDAQARVSCGAEYVFERRKCVCVRHVHAFDRRNVCPQRILFGPLLLLLLLLLLWLLLAAAAAAAAAACCCLLLPLLLLLAACCLLLAAAVLCFRAMGCCLCARRRSGLCPAWTSRARAGPVVDGGHRHCHRSTRRFVIINK